MQNYLVDLSIYLHLSFYIFLLYTYLHSIQLQAYFMQVGSATIEILNVGHLYTPPRMPFVFSLCVGMSHLQHVTHLYLFLGKLYKQILIKQFFVDVVDEVIVVVDVVKVVFVAIFVVDVGGDGVVVVVVVGDGCVIFLCIKK